MSAAPAATQGLTIRGLRKSFGGNAVLHGLDLVVEPGEFVVMLGRSGSGKSTLLRIVAGLEQAEADEYAVPDNAAVAFQEPRLLPWEKVWRNVTMGLSGADARERAERALTEVGLGHRSDAWPVTLSGGEAQRASLARALVRNPSLLLLDEPFGALDALTRRAMHALLLDLWDRYRPTILMVTHDVDEAVLLADRVVVLDDGELVGNHRIDSPRPRTGHEPELQSAHATLLRLLGVHV